MACQGASRRRWSAAGLLLVSPVVAARLSGQEADLQDIALATGSESAPVTVVEYADFACSACAQFATDVWPTVRRTYVETGKVHWMVIPFEIGFPNSAEGARAGRCAAELGAFWEVHDLLYERRSEWEGERNPQEPLVEIAVDAGLDRQAFAECYDDDRGQDRTRAANRAARRDGIRGTPTFFVNGRRVQGALPLAAFVELLESALAEAGGGPGLRGPGG